MWWPHASVCLLHITSDQAVCRVFIKFGIEVVYREMLKKRSFEEWKTNLMSLAILFHFLCAQHVSDINISIIRSLRLCCWITTSVFLFSVRCVLQAEALLQPAKRAPLKTSLTKSPTHNELRTSWSSASACKTSTTQNQPHQILQHTTNWEQDDRCGNSTTQSQAPDDGYINARNMLST